MIAVMLSLMGCDLVGQSCNLMYAPDFLTVEITDGDGWAGEIAVSIDGDGTVVTCAFTEEDDAIVNCDDDMSSMELAGDVMTLSLWDFAPDSADLVVTIDGVEVSAQTIKPVYEVDEPNGEGCGERRSATEAVTL